MKRLCRALPLLCFREWKKTEVCMWEANDERHGSPASSEPCKFVIAYLLDCGRITKFLNMKNIQEFITFFY